MNRSWYHLLTRIWKKRWQVSFTILFLLVEYYMLTAFHETNFVFDGFTSSSTKVVAPPSIAPTTAPRVVVTESRLAETPPAAQVVPVSGTIAAERFVSESPPYMETPTTHETESPGTTSSELGVSVDFAARKDCFISSYSNDGIGHQMEAKISCLATALILNRRNMTLGQWTYIHQPVNELQHGQDPAVMEKLFGFSKILADAIYDPETMALSTREMAAWPPQPEDMMQIFNALCPGNNETTEKAIVYTADNCWDFFYSQNEPLPEEWHTQVVPLLRTTILQGTSYVPKNDTLFPHKTKRIPGRCFIVMHIRLGDADDRQMSGDWIQAVWHNLLTAQELLNQQKHEGNENATAFLSFQLAIHSDGTRDTVLDMLQFSDETVVFMENASTPDTLDDTEKSIVSLYCRNEEHSSLMTTLYDMLTADVFITSDSALSHTASLLRDPTRDGPTVHPPTTGQEGREQLGTTLGRFFLKKSENDTTMLLWSSREEWNAVDASFWTKLFEVYLSQSMFAPA